MVLVSFGISLHSIEKIQAKNNNVIVDKLKPGTKVYKTIEGLQNKLTPKNRGPYTIVNSTKNDNYILKNVLGELLKDSYLLCKHKLDKGIEEDINNFQKFEKILDHRKRNKEFMRIFINRRVLFGNYHDKFHIAHTQEYRLAQMDTYIRENEAFERKILERLYREYDVGLHMPIENPEDETNENTDEKTSNKE
ncbi:unnamed protein product [Brachionus calyciflorus]|uniref:Uncharacterized protein n=1 Tax=Brachionus calyciflorus TaxID=104777 RepID=A0A813P045_9BILA|nr:unnamed protein product [Brachionus calyciflorus]